MATVTVNTSQYVGSHGKAPRGYGCWAFAILDSIYFCTDSYSKAVRLAIKAARRESDKHRLGYIPRITVLP